MANELEDDFVTPLQSCFPRTCIDAPPFLLWRMVLDHSHVVPLSLQKLKLELLKGLASAGSKQCEGDDNMGLN